MVYMGSEVLQIVERQQLGRAFFELGVRGGRMRWWLTEVVVKGRQFHGPRYEL